METCRNITVRRDDELLINNTANRLDVTKEKYLTYLNILADRETFDRYHISHGSQELGWEDWCEYSEEEMGVYYKIGKMVRENKLESVIARNLKVVESTVLNGRLPKKRNIISVQGFTKITLSSPSSSNTYLSQ